MRWEPDTCSCVIIIEVTDSVKFIEMENICKEHSSLKGYAAYMAASTKNREKNIEENKNLETKK